MLHKTVLSELNDVSRNMACAWILKELHGTFVSTSIGNCIVDMPLL